MVCFKFQIWGLSENDAFENEGDDFSKQKTKEENNFDHFLGCLVQTLKYCHEIINFKKKFCVLEGLSKISR